MPVVPPADPIPVLEVPVANRVDRQLPADSITSPVYHTPSEVSTDAQPHHDQVHFAQPTATTTERKVINVALTGFGPFRTFDTNPSWEALEPLNGCFYDLPDGRQVRLTCFEIPVVYEQVTTRVSALHHLPHPDIKGKARGAAYPPSAEFDVFIHVGVAGRSDISFERRARRYGYGAEDHEGLGAPSALDPASGEVLSGFVQPEWAVCEMGEQELRGVVDVDGLAEKVASSGLAAGAYVSDDAGLFLCEYIYYASMAASIRAASDRGGSRKPVSFIHVPPENKPYSIQELTHILHATVMQLVESL